MKAILLFLTLTLLTITGCTSTPVPEKDIVTIYVPVEVNTVNVKHPPLPQVVSSPDYEVQVLTVKTIIETLKETVSMATELTDDDKVLIQEILDAVETLQLNKDPLIYSALDQVNAEKEAIYLEKLVTALEEYKAIITYYRKQEAVIIVEDTE